MKKNEFKDKSEKDLKEALNEKRKKLSGMKLGVQTGNVKEAVSLRKDIARILTALNAKNK